MNLNAVTQAPRRKLDDLARLLTAFAIAGEAPDAANRQAAECRQAVARARADALAGGVALDPGALERLRSAAASADLDAAIALDVEIDLAGRLERESVVLAELEDALMTAGSEIANPEALKLLTEARTALAGVVQAAVSLLIIPNRGGLKATLAPIFAAASALGIELTDQRNTADAKGAREARAVFGHLAEACERIREALEARRERLRRAAEDAANARAREQRFGAVA